MSSHGTRDSWSCQISPPWIIDVKKDKYFKQGDASLVLGGTVIVRRAKFDKYNFFLSIIRNYWSSEESKSSYLSCCESTFRDYSRVVRRFHFDTGDGNPSTLEAKSHVQFGGECNEEEAITQLHRRKLHYCLDKKLEIPRLAFPPVDIILLFDLVVRQFNTVIDTAFVESKEWVNLVQTSENFRPRNYYRQIADYYQERDVRDSVREARSGSTEKPKRPRTLFEAMCQEDFCL